MAVLTIRDVPEEVREALAREARQHRQSLQAFLLAVLNREAAYSHNRQLIADIERDLADGGGAGDDAPDAAKVLAQARAERANDEPGHGSGGAA